jgi:hypothetical protein
MAGDIIDVSDNIGLRAVEYGDSWCVDVMVRTSALTKHSSPGWKDHKNVKAAWLRFSGGVKKGRREEDPVFPTKDEAEVAICAFILSYRRIV